MEGHEVSNHTVPYSLRKQNCISGLKLYWSKFLETLINLWQLLIRVKYDREYGRGKIMPIEWGSGKFKEMLFHFAANKIYLFVFLFEFTHLKVPCSKIQKGGNFNFFFFLFLVPSYLISSLNWCELHFFWKDSYYIELAL